MRRAVELFLVLAFLAASNVHLPVLQVAAWAGMLMRYSQDRSLAEAASMTFDGEHPCSMCEAIKRQQEQSPSLSDATIAAKPQLYLQMPAPWIQQIRLLGALPDTAASACVFGLPPERKPPRTSA